MQGSTIKWFVSLTAWQSEKSRETGLDYHVIGLRWLLADERRLGPMVSSSHQALVVALPNAKGNISHSLRTLETRGLITIGRTLGGKAAYVALTLEGRNLASKLA